jgi:hypothetical protein
LAAIQFSSRYFVYWDLDSNGLHQRRFWSKKEIGWGTVLHVRNCIPGIRWDGTVSVYYDRPASKSGFGYVVTGPEHRMQFIEAVRKFAPQATFDL